MPEFVGQPIKVIYADKPAPPTAFIWEGRTIQILRVMEEWQDWSFGSTHPVARNWRTRRHRNYYRVLGDDGCVYEIYMDRASGGRRLEWYLYRIVDKRRPD